VQNTNDFSTVSKVSTAATGYFTDEFQKYFVSRTSRRSPLIHRGYCVRSQAVNHCIKEFLQDTKDSAHRQVLSLGCGFDSLYFRMSSNLSDDYKLLGVDLGDIPALDSALDSAGLRCDCPTLVLAEVVLCYVDPARSTSVIGWAAQRFPHSRFIIYEQFSPSDPFGQVMMNHFVSLNSALRSVAAYPQLEDQERRFLQQGWEQCRILDMNEFSALCVSDMEKSRIESLEPFDEFEELHLKCSHYFILAASRGILADCSALRPICDLHTGMDELYNDDFDFCSISGICIEQSRPYPPWSGKQYVFVFGGRAVPSAALHEEGVFLQVDELRWVQVGVTGTAPPQCHSHSSSGWNGAAVISGGLLESGVPTGSVFILHPLQTHFEWEKLETNPPLTPRYAHTSHVIGDKLLLVGGVWIHRRGVPGLAVVDLKTGQVSEFELDTASLEWPLMLHGHSSVLLQNSKQVVILGGGGTCFSFGTHLNAQPVVVDLSFVLC
ncbi:tRNA wybutosine-synthesizing protein 4, partial [Pyxicephalus adspersus]|uniref:tRNA wybutosine-synthesizing protein 4 n=1 Tax=Pyxicephalus adspersus TaxID=30357 RepID=UPI003B5C014A